MDLMQIRELMSTGVSLYDIPLNVTFYGRISTDKEEQQSSLEHQISYFKDLIGNSVKWNFCNYYIDEGISGTSVLKRIAFQDMIADAKSHKFDLILTKEVSRFARNTLDSISFTRKLLSYGVGVLFTNDNINTLEADSEFRLTIMASMAQEESRRISSRVRFGSKMSIKNGVVLGNNNFLGYKKQNGKLIINDSEAIAIQTVFEMYASGENFTKIATTLADMGYTSSSGKVKSFNAIQTIITNPKYKGYYCGGKSVKTDLFTSKRIRLDASRWTMWKDETKSIVPAIVSEELWDRCNELYLTKCKSNKINKRSLIGEYEEIHKGLYDYSNLLICNRCKSPYWRVIKNARRNTKTESLKESWVCKEYKLKGKKGCTAPILYTTDMNIVLRHFFGNFKNQKVSDSLFESAKQIYLSVCNSSTDKTRLAEMESSIERLKVRKAKLLDMSLDGAITTIEFTMKNVAIADDIIKSQLELEKLKSYSLDADERLKSLKNIRQQIDKMCDFEGSEIEDLVCCFINCIRVDYDDSYTWKRPINVSQQIERRKVDLFIELKSKITIKQSFIKECGRGIKYTPPIESLPPLVNF